MIGGLILLYHRVARPGRDPQLLCVRPERFAEHLAVLRRCCRPMPLRQLVERAGAGEDVDRAAAVTFDDGYFDNALVAAPLLARHRIPATMFVTTALLDTDSEFFWDDLDRILLSDAPLPSHLRLRVAGREIEIRLDEAAAEPAGHPDWTVLDTVDPTPRQRAYRELCTALHQACAAERRIALDALQEWSGIPRRASRRMMSRQELRTLAAEPLIEIGAHTVDHPSLSVESAAEQRNQMERSRTELEAIVQRPVTTISYPFGTRRDFTADTMRLAREIGFQNACANFAGNVTAASDPYQLPRRIVRDWTGAEFEARLDEWLKPASETAQASSVGNGVRFSTPEARTTY